MLDKLIFEALKNTEPTRCGECAELIVRRNLVATPFRPDWQPRILHVASDITPINSSMSRSFSTGWRGSGVTVNWIWRRDEVLPRGVEPPFHATKACHVGSLNYLPLCKC